MEKNTVKQEELKKKIKEIDFLMQNAKTSFLNLDDLIAQTIDSKKGIWDGEEAKQFKEDYRKLAHEIPTIIDFFITQNNNIKLLIEKNNANQQNANQQNAN
ncbi:MAG: hypothetical protein IKE70_02450 [Bacilli bacterium]|nr:hypothetical protein [Bacilli bacterium]